MRAVAVAEDLIEAAAGSWNAAISNHPHSHGNDKAIGLKRTVVSYFTWKPQRLSFDRKVRVGAVLCTWLFFCSLTALLLTAEQDSNGSSPKVVMAEIASPTERVTPPALRGMGMIFSEGDGMKELIVAHLTERVTPLELGTFVRTAYRSGAIAKADLIILFPTRDQNLFETVRAECDLGRKLVLSQTNESSPVSPSALSAFNANAYRHTEEDVYDDSDTEGGRRRRQKRKKVQKQRDQEGLRIGSVMGFEMEELDPANIMSAFIEDPPAQLRRWACYHLLLGMLRHRYQSILLARIGSVLLLGDIMAATARSDSRQLFLVEEGTRWNVPASSDEYNAEAVAQRTPRRSKGRGVGGRHRRGGKGGGTVTLVEAVYGAEAVTQWATMWAAEEKAKRQRMVSSGLVMGSTGAVRALCGVMLNEVVRVALDRGQSCRRAFPDRVAMSYVVRISSVLRRRLSHGTGGGFRLLDGSANTSLVWNAAVINVTKGTAWSRLLRRGAGPLPLALDGIHESSASAFHLSVRQDICASSTTDAALYPDCH